MASVVNVRDLGYEIYTYFQYIFAPAQALEGLGRLSADSRSGRKVSTKKLFQTTLFHTFTIGVTAEMCPKCRAGQIEEYSKIIRSNGHDTTITGRRCSLCGFTELDNDDDIWSTVGL
jgi:predicted Zn-ribbon and HTH transcriptional regulator